MRIKSILAALLICFSMFSCAASEAPTETLKLGVITDLHYLSEKLMDKGETAQAYSQSSGRNILATPEVLDQVINEYLKSDIDVLFIPGDLTKDGERQSHLDLVTKLQPLLDKGVRIYVIPGNHDINMPNSQGFKAGGTYPVKNINPTEFEEIYNRFGYGDALKRDDSSLSYVAELDANKWLLAIDGCRYKEYTTGSISGGRISKETENWVVSILDEARKKGITVVGMMHHGLVEHIMYQDMFFEQYLVEDWQRLANLFADKGMKAIFTGHFHATDITKFTSKAEQSIFDIETGALCTYPFAYRFIDMTSKGMDIRTKNIVSTASYPNLVEDEKIRTRSLAQRLAVNKLRSRNFGLSESAINKFSELVSQIFLLHVMGDEVVDDNLKDVLKNIGQEMGMPIELDSTSLQLDFYPPDNNVSITFD